MDDDPQLLTAYARHADQGAFAELVHRHIDLVYAAALRQTRGDRHLAEDVTQATFLILAQKAGRLPPGIVLAGWLHATARYAAANAMKSAARRARREQRKFQMDANPAQVAPSADPDTAWDDVAPHLDAALASLAARDRDAVLLRYVQDKTHVDVGRALGISEEAARKRITRALDRLRTILHRRGVAVPATALGASLTTHATTAAPPAVVATVLSSSACVVAPPATTAALAKSTLSTIAWIKAKLAAACIAAAAIVTTGGAITVHKLTADARGPAAPPAPLRATAVLALADPVPPPAPPPPAQAQIKIEGILRTPADAPAQGADIYVVMPEDPAVLAEQRAAMARRMAGDRNAPPPPKRPQTDVGVYETTWPDDAQATDATGRFSFTGLKEPWTLVARHDTGYVELTHDQYKKLAGGDVYLQPWGKVEGTLRVGAQPQVNQKIALFRIGSRDDWQLMRVRHTRYVTTDPEGHFVFDRVAPGDSWIAWEPKVKNNFRQSRYTLAELEPGKSITLDLGGRGQSVVGRAATVAANLPDQKITWATIKDQNATASYNNRIANTAWKSPPDWELMTPAQQAEWRKAWENTPEGKETKRHQWGEDIDIKPDGSFRIDDLLPGLYVVNCRLFHNENAFGEDLADCSAEFTVPPLPKGVDRVDTPLDIGTIPVTLKPRALVGQVAPDFTATRLDDGKPLRLSDYKGKYVVLKWWWNWSELDTEVPAMKKAYDAIKDDKDWVLITLAFDDHLETAKKRVADHAIPGLHAHVPSYSQNFPRAYLGSPSTLIIIGPDGKVLARNLHPENAETEIAKIRLERDH